LLTWCASTALDFAIFHVFLTTALAPGLPPVWQEIAQTVPAVYDNSGDIPALGEVLIYDVQAADFAGNMSQRGDPLDDCP